MRAVHTLTGATESSGRDGHGRTRTLAVGGIDQQRAGQIATDRFGGRVLNVEADQARGELAWEVEVADGRKDRIEVDVSGTTGAIFEMERD